MSWGLIVHFHKNSSNSLLFWNHQVLWQGPIRDGDPLYAQRAPIRGLCAPPGAQHWKTPATAAGFMLDTKKLSNQIHKIGNRPLLLLKQSLTCIPEGLFWKTIFVVVCVLNHPVHARTIRTNFKTRHGKKNVQNVFINPIELNVFIYLFLKIPTQ